MKSPSNKSGSINNNALLKNLMEPTITYFRLGLDDVPIRAVAILEEKSQVVVSNSSNLFLSTLEGDIIKKATFKEGVT